jgi:hypothetical protein
MSAAPAPRTCHECKLYLNETVELTTRDKCPQCAHPACDECKASAPEPKWYDWIVDWVLGVELAEEALEEDQDLMEYKWEDAAEVEGEDEEMGNADEWEIDEKWWLWWLWWLWWNKP